MQHFAGANHLQHVNRQQVDLKLAVYTPACNIVRWVDEREWKIRMRMITAQRPVVEDASATGVATGTSTQFLGMVYASGAAFTSGSKENPQPHQ